MTDVFEGKIAIVTGGTSGIGYAVSEELLKRGATVRVIGSRKESVEKAKASLASYPNAKFSAVDVRDYAAVEKMVADCVTESGRLDYLFNNAGISQKYPYEYSTMAGWKEIIDINLWGVIHGINAALPVMRRQKGGHIINTASVAALLCIPYQSLYVTTKSAVVGLTDCLYYEYLKENIFFSAICPGNVATPLFKGDFPEDAIPVKDAALIILDGVERRERMIVFPEAVKEILEKCKDPVFRDTAHWQSEKEAREHFATPDYQEYLAELKRRT